MAAIGTTIANFIQIPANDLFDLCLPTRHYFVVKRQRRATIDHRVRAAARYVAALTIGWIAVDAITFSDEVWVILAGERLLTALALTVLAMTALHERDGGLMEARALCVVLVILGFFLATSYTLSATHANMESLAAVSAYANLPFLVAAGIGLFPVVAVEGLLVTGLVLASTLLVATVLPALDAARFYNTGSLWLLLTICAVATLGGMLQLRSLIGVTRQSSRDGLTGLMLRGFGEELLAAQFAVATRAERPLAVVFLDLDKFKAVNDDHGHEAGDAVLETAGAAIDACVRGQDTAVRWGGEEFLIILPNTDISGARKVADRLGQHGLGLRPEGRPLTASVGLTERLIDEVGNAADLVAIGDQRVYAAKDAGRNRVKGVADDPWEFVPTDHGGAP